MKQDATQTFTALELLNEYLELAQLSPKPAKWPSFTESGDAPRYYRFQRLQALFRAFELPLDFKNFPHGGFLADRDAGSFQPLTEAVAAYIRQAGKAEPGRERDFDLRQWQFVYGKFFSLLRSVRKLQAFNSGVMEASLGPYSYAVAATGAAVAGLETPALQVVTAALTQLIDPVVRSFDRATLIDQYGFPDVDLFDVDLDWF